MVRDAFVSMCWTKGQSGKETEEKHDKDVLRENKEENKLQKERK